METVLLRTYRFRYEGDIDRAVLDAAGIRCVLVGDDAGGLAPHIMSANPIRLFVAEDEAGLALQALTEQQAGRGEDADTVDGGVLP